MTDKYVPECSCRNKRQWSHDWACPVTIERERKFAELEKFVAPAVAAWQDGQRDPEELRRLSITASDGRRCMIYRGRS